MNKKVNVLVDHGILSGSSDFFPLYRWKKKLNEHGIRVNIFHSLNSKIKNADAIILASRHFETWQDITKRNNSSGERLFSDLTELSKYTDNLIWFDNSDGTGTTEFDVVPYVDTFCKKQFLKDKTRYTTCTKESVRVWLPSSIQSSYKSATNFDYKACPEDHLYKLKLAWNIGFNDYRFSNKYLKAAFSLSVPGLFGFNSQMPAVRKEIDILNRGSLYNENSVHSYQRNIAVSRLREIKNKYAEKNIIAEGFVKKSDYYNELRKSRIVLSPFGWGEVCYKDFEIILAGSLLLKPSMDHMDTFPDVYRGNTYIKMQWDMSDLAEIIDHLSHSPHLVTDISANARKLYTDLYNNGELFCEHFSEIIKKPERLSRASQN